MSDTKQQRERVRPFWRRWWESYMDEKIAMAHARARAAMARDPMVRIEKAIDEAITKAMTPKEDNNGQA